MIIYTFIYRGGEINASIEVPDGFTTEEALYALRCGAFREHTIITIGETHGDMWSRINDYGEEVE